MIDYNNILTELIRVVREVPFTVPLSITDGLPSVLRMRPNNPKLQYPYVTIDVLDTSLESGWELNTFVDENDNNVYEANYHLLISFRVYGGDALADSQSIMSQLDGHLRIERVLNDITKATGGEVLVKLPVENSPILLDDKYIESSSFNIIFGITDTTIDIGTDGVPITTIDLDGELKTHPEDPNPLEADVFVTKP